MASSRKSVTPRAESREVLPERLIEPVQEIKIDEVAFEPGELLFLTGYDWNAIGVGLVILGARAAAGIIVAEYAFRRFGD